MNELPAILLVDDWPPEGHVFSMLTVDAGLPNEVVYVDNGQAALDYLNDPDRDSPGLVLLDIRMPGKSGLETLAEIRSSPPADGFRSAGDRSHRQRGPQGPGRS